MGRPKIDPVVWRAPKPTARARRRTSDEDFSVEIWPLPARGEDVFVMPDGAIFTGLDDGRLVRVHPGGKVDEIVRTGGRPMGFDLAPDGRLLVCDAFRGLLAVDVATGTIEILVDEVDGRPMKFCNSVTAAPDGALYFTDSSRRFGLDNWRADIFEHSGTGRLLRREPDGTVETVLDGLQFANGVTLDGSRTRVVVAETGAYRLTALHISGPRTGETEILHDNLPGSPDNLARGPGGLIWVALPNPRDPRLDLLHRTPPCCARSPGRYPSSCHRRFGPCG